MQANSAWGLALANLATEPRPELEPEKTCGRCKEIKPISAFYMMGGRISRSCKTCHKAHVYLKRGRGRA